MRRLPTFAGRVGAFLAEISFQIFGYGSYLIPAFIAIAGWHYFWCLTADAIYTKLTGAGSARWLQLGVSGADAWPRGLRAARLSSRRLHRRMDRRLDVRLPQSNRLDHRDPRDDVGRDDPGDAVLIWPAGETSLFGDQGQRERGAGSIPYGERRTTQGETAPRDSREVRQEGGAGRCALQAGEEARGCAAAVERAADPLVPRTPPVVQKKAAKAPITPPLPLPEPDRTQPERRLGSYTLPPLSLLDAPKAERKIDERELMDSARLLEEKCREFSVEGSVVQIHPVRSSPPSSSSPTPASNTQR